MVERIALLTFVDFDLGMNASSGYVPSAAVLGNRAVGAAEERIATMLCAVDTTAIIVRAGERRGVTFQVMLTDLTGAAYAAKLAEIFAFLKRNAAALNVTRVRLDGGALYVTLDPAIDTCARLLAPTYYAVLAARGAKVAA